jgi:hypothetical protein
VFWVVTPCSTQADTDVSEEYAASIVKVKSCHNPDNYELNSHHHENFKTYNEFIAAKSAGVS